MTTTYSADEVFEIAEQIENSGYKFYQAAASNASAKDVKNVFTKLANMELRHAETFATLRAYMVGEQDSGAYDPDDQTSKYLSAMIAGCVYEDHHGPAAQLTGDEAPADVLRIAIGLERSAIAFYLGIKQAVTCQKTKDSLNAIITEEMSHVVVLTEVLETCL